VIAAARTLPAATQESSFAASIFSITKARFANDAYASLQRSPSCSNQCSGAAGKTRPLDTCSVSA
jgi:hypothetical protein